jgi:glycerol uptake operon antiterminator
MTLQYALLKNPIIASLRDPEGLDEMLASSTHIAFILNADICTLQPIVQKIQKTGKLVFVHIDLMAGLKKDPSSVQYLATQVCVDGIVSTHASLIAVARKNGLLTVQRIFFLDSASMEQGLKTALQADPDAIEILPGIIIPHVISKIREKTSKPIIAGGLINTHEEIQTILQHGAMGVSTSATRLWNFPR